MAARATCRCGWTKTYPTKAKAEFNAARHVCPAARGIRRATRTHRCARCGYEATYFNAGATEARYWFSKHSCQKHEQRMLRSALAQQRLSLIDRTPQPCLHKYANHQHGERTTYVLDKCRCLPCSAANSAAQTQRERLKAYGRYHKYVMAEHVRAHLRDLADYGIGLKQVAKLSGVSTGTLSKIMFGVYPTTGTGGGRNGPGIKIREPSRRVLRRTAEAIYEISPVPANLGAGQKDHERTPTARLHLRALVALGWSQAKLATRLGILPTNLGPVIGDGRTLRRGTVDKIEALYAELSMTLPPETNQRERIAASRARNYAKDRGWLPPLDLEDVDSIETTDDVDEVAVLRRLNGDRSFRLNAGEAAEVVRRARARGMTGGQIERDLGIKPKRYVRLRDQEVAS